MNPDYLAPLIYERDRWQAMADQAGNLLWISDTTGDFTRFNAAWLRWRGRQIHQELGPGWMDGLHPDDQQFWRNTYADHFKRRQAFTTQIRLADAQGRYGLVSISARPWLAADGTFAGFVGDAHVQARPSEPGASPDTDLYRATIEALHEGVVVTDADGMFLTVNDAAVVFLGQPRHTLIGHDLASRTIGIDMVDEHGVSVPHDHRPTVTARRSRQPVSGQLLGWHVKDQGLRWFSFNSRPLLSPEGSVTAVVTSFLDVTVQKHAADDARREARHDALTGLMNRWGLRDVVRQILERTPRQGENVALLYCDLDNFKEVNDRLGHASGDMLLRQVAQRIRSCVRSGDIVARMGGDEVVAVLDEVNGLHGAMAAAEKVRAAVAQPCVLSTAVVEPRVSIGVAILGSFEEFDETLNRADEAMYTAKAAGRNRVMTLDEAEPYSGCGRPNK